MTMLRIPIAATAMVAFALFSGAAQAAVDWSKVPLKDITLLYPGQMSWELLLTNKEHSGGDKFKGGKKGDKLTVTWVDNKGDTRTDEATIT